MSIISQDEKEKIKKILIIKPSSIGDIFHCFPAIALLKNAFPSAEFDWFVRDSFQDILRYSPVKLHKIISFNRKDIAKLKNFGRVLLENISQVRAEKYDLVIDFQGLIRSAFFCSISRAKYKVGFKRPKEAIASFAYNKKISIAEKWIHAVDKNVALVEELSGCQRGVAKPQLPTLEPVADKVRQLLLSSGFVIDSLQPLVGVVVGARWPSKCWPDSFFAEFITRLISRRSDCRVVLIGTQDDSARAIKIKEAVKAPQLLSLVGKTNILELVELIRQCNCLISNDSGPVHIAAALHKTVFGLFGPTSPQKTGPYGNEHQIFQKIDLPCVPCFKRQCPLEGDERYKCHNIATDEVLDKVLNFLDEG